MQRSFCLVLLSVLIALTSHRIAVPQPHALAAPLPPGEIGEFVAFCPFSHEAADDPIVFPGEPGRAHSHDFFGNQTTDAYSTLETLLSTSSNCDPPADRSAYWVPTLYDSQGTPIRVEHATFYYTVSINNPESLQPFPLGLKIIAGNAAATAPEEPSQIKWSCLGSPESSTGDFIVCPEGSKLELLINFPDCWDGQNLDSPDHKSHMAYSVGNECPPSHPVPVPILQFKLRYSTNGEQGMYLSSGPGYTAHGDFFNAWEPEAMDHRVECLRKLMKCGPEGLSIRHLPVISR